MCAANWKCILSSRARGGGSGVLAIVIWGMALGTKASPRLGQSWTRRQQHLGTTGFEVDKWNREQTGLTWGRGSHPGSFGGAKSRPPHPGRKGQPQQVPHKGGISAFKGQPQQVPHQDCVSAFKHPSSPN